jgi:preprotein translocase subunit YajC
MTYFMTICLFVVYPFFMTFSIMRLWRSIRHMQEMIESIENLLFEEEDGDSVH